MGSKTKGITLVEQLQKARDKATQHRIVIIEALVGLALLIALVRLGYGVEWTGFKFYQHPQTLELVREKTLWDWLDLLIVPIVLAVGGLLFNRSERKAERRIAEERTQTEREFAANRTREAALQSYLDKMTELLLDRENGLRESETDSEVRTIARARTLTVLRGLDGQRKGMLLRFLHEASLVDSPAVIELHRADLVEAYLHRAALSGAKLSGTGLMEANLSRADLSGADLSGAGLMKANLSGADLSGADLRWANLSGANLSGADLGDARLHKTTMLPDDTQWTPDTDLARFTDPDHPNFWRSDDPNSPAYRGKDGD